MVGRNQEIKNAGTFVEGPGKLDTSQVGKNGGAGTTIDQNKLLLNVNEANALLGTSITNDDDEQKKQAGNAKRRLGCAKARFSLFSCVKKTCSLAPNKGILKGLRRSIPNRQHIIHYWRNQLANRINQRKCAIMVDGNADLNITYRELDEFSNLIAYNLKQSKFSGNFQNLNPNGELVIAVCHPACYEYVVVLLAILKLGAALLPISVDLPAERIAEIIKLTQPVLFIASPQEDELFEDVRSMVEFEIMYVDEIWNMLANLGAVDNSALAFNSPIQSPDPKKPYPAMSKRSVVISVVPSVTHEIQALAYDSRAILNRVKWEDHFFVYFTSELVLIPPNFDTVDSVAEVLTALVVGVTMIAYQSSTDIFIPEQLFSYCQTYKIRRLTLWPSLLKACMSALQLFDFYAQQVRTVRYWFCSGAVMKNELAEVFFEMLPPRAQLIHMYHFEDCSGAVAFQIYETLVSRKDRKFYSRLPVGYPVPNMDIYILDRNLKPVQDGEMGEIYVSGVQLPRISKLGNSDYLFIKNPFSKHKDRKFMLRTLDFGRIHIKSNGSRVLIHETSRSRHYFIDNEVVWLQVVERYVMRLTHLVKRAHCVCYRPDEDDQLILAFCVPVASETHSIEIEDELKNVLSLHTVPEVFTVAEIPLILGTSFPDENALLKIYQERRIERQFFDEWKKVDIRDQFVLRAAKILCYFIYTYLGVPVKYLVERCWNEPYLAIRRATVTKAAFIVKELHRNRYPIFVDDFVYAENLGEIAALMIEARRERGCCNRNCPADEVVFMKNRYKLEILVNGHRTTVCSLLAKCFTQRGSLDYYAEVSQIAMRRYFDATWPIFVSKKLSIVIRKKKEKNKMVGCCLSINWHDEIKLTTSIPVEIAYKLELIQNLELALTDSHFPQDKTNVMQICYLGLDSKVLSDTEIHGLTDKIIRSLLAYGRVKGFEALVVINYDYFSLDICVNNYGFHVAKQCQVNQFVASDGVKPYALCPDTMIASICWKLLGDLGHVLTQSEKQHNKLIGLCLLHEGSK